MSIRKYIYASLAFICLMCSCDPWLVPPVKITYEEDANGHKYVDLGLSVKWAAYDIGANSATELGDFFAWGETQPKKGYSWATYKFAVPYKSPEYGNTEYELTKYNLDPNSEYYDGKTTLDLIDDAAHMAWGGNWRMPTADECEELIEKCEWTWTEYLGVEGYDVKGPNGNRIFLPTMVGRDMLYQDYTLLYRWSSNCLNNNDTYYNPEKFAYLMAGNGFGEVNRCLGLFVRAVYDKSLPKYSVLTFDANGGEGLMHPQQFNKGVSQSIDSVRYTNGILNFVAWNTQPDGSGQSFANGQEITLDKNTTLYAQWAFATGSENGYDYVDLGLPSGTKWAIYNVGATSPEGYGDYFAWGETSPKDNYDWSTYKYCNGSENTITKYYIENDLGRGDEKNTLDLIDDAARVNWGGKWRMPTDTEIRELIDHCSWVWTTQNGINGYLVTSKKNANKLFLPAAGYRNATTLVGDGSFGDYWMRLCPWGIYSQGYANYLRFNSGEIIDYYNRERYYGHTVRAVFSENSTFVTLTFDANGGEGTMTSQLFEVGVAQALVANTFTRDGYTFTGWNTAPDGSGTSYTDGQEITLTEDVTLYAQWESAGGSGGGSSTSDTENGYEWVDLGLPSGLKWATCNVGATSPEGYGDYFAWGETSPKDNYEWSTYKYCNGSEDTMTKYCTNSSYGTNGFTDNKTTLDLSDDAARANWGGKWRMPTKAEQEELMNNCTWTWTTQNGVNGCRLTSKTNGNSIFLPAAGYRKGISVIGVGSDGGCWPSLLDESHPSYAYYLYFNSGRVDWLCNYRYRGRTVRAVFSENDTPSTFVTITFDANGGSGTMAAQTFEADISQAIAANAFSRSGYTFTGWNTKADGSGTSYTDGQKITLSQDITLYAQWESAGGSGGGSSTSGTENGYEWVDLGLPSGLNWATCNVGATTPEGYGDYFAWGETSPKDNYDWWTYKYCNGLYSTLTKYNTNSSYGMVDNKTTLYLTDDAARVNWGGNWRMPTAAECNELFEKCEWTWTTQNGVNGYKVTSKTNGNSIFLPAAGYRRGTSVRSVGSDGSYWSSSLYESDPGGACYLIFDSGIVVDWDNGFRYDGLTVRAVFSENDTPSTFVTLTFDANGGSGTMSAQPFEAGITQTLAPNKFTRSGYYFSGWNTSPDGSGTAYTDQQEITLTQDITLYAQWQEKALKGTENGYEWVDLGLPSGLNWATCNVGATTPDGYGDYFAWGETSPKDNYDWSTYKYCYGSETTLTKYNINSSYGMVDNKTVLDLTDDAARVNWGGKWRMPTKVEQDELRNNCTWTWTTQNGVNGYKVTSNTNGNSIFLPAAGSYNGTSVSGVGSGGYCWSSSLYAGPGGAYVLNFNSGGGVGSNAYNRKVGFTVRAVFSENDTPSTFVTLTFDANGGEGTMAVQPFEAGITQTLAPNKFTRSGYTFTGWNTKADGSGTSYTDKQSITLSQDITLYAQWEQEQKQVVSGTENGHDYVDLGLPSGLKWATCNVGATTPEAYGDYFAWGETSPKDNYEWSTYKYCNGSETTLTKYNTSSSYGTVDNKHTLELSDDAARANWGGKWRMPTTAEQEELINNSTWTWTTQNGVNGYKVTSKTNGNSIFLPAAGYRYATSVYNVGSLGYYWSSSLREGDPSYAYVLYFNLGYVDWGATYRYYCFTVRAVCP